MCAAVPFATGVRYADVLEAALAALDIALVDRPDFYLQEHAWIGNEPTRTPRLLPRHEVIALTSATPLVELRRSEAVG